MRESRATGQPLAFARACVLLLVVLAAVPAASCWTSPAAAQSYGADAGFLSLPVETVTVSIANPSADKAYNDSVTDGFRKFLAVYPGDYFNENAAAFAIARVRRNPEIADVTYRYALGRGGGLDVTFTITLAAKGQRLRGARLSHHQRQGRPSCAL